MQTERIVVTEEEKAVIDALRALKRGKVEVVKSENVIRVMHSTETTTFDK